LVDISDEKNVKKADQKQKHKRTSDLLDLKEVLSTVPGRKTIWRILEKCGTFQSTFSTESLNMGYLSGQQDIGHYIMSEIVQADEEALFTMMKENKEKV